MQNTRVSIVTGRTERQVELEVNNDILQWETKHFIPYDFKMVIENGLLVVLIRYELDERVSHEKV